MAKGADYFNLNQERIIGVGFPLDRESIVEGNTNVKDQLKSDLLMLLLTDPGERVFLLDYGVGLKKLLFEPNGENITETLKTMINKKLSKFLPQISILSTQTNSNLEEDPHSVSISIQFKYNIDNSADSIQLNFKNNI